MVVRIPAVAGQFYPLNPRELEATVRNYVTATPYSLDVPPRSVLPKALIVPHAGYMYSGSVAGHVYSLLQPVRKSVHRVILVGPSHYVHFEGIGITSADAFETPLGDIPIDRETNSKLLELPFVVSQDEAHGPEHSLEVQLPFLRQCLDNFELVPLVFGRIEPAHIADALRLVWGGAETLIVISSDLSHFLDDESCRRIDTETAQIIESLDTERLTSERACGAKGIQGLMILAREKGLHIRTLELKNSSDASGDRRRVVGYGGFYILSDSISSH